MILPARKTLTLHLDILVNLALTAPPPSPHPRLAACLFLGKGDFHGIGWRDLEALQSLFGSSSLHVCLKLHKGNVMATWHQSNLLESREPVQHKLC